ncbi:short-chain dehydrogenase/reductase [Nocardia nova]|uniref:Short-chain dehydrogenase/reductase n=1 Tax=Nocardia nova TaxID=37330 RepID=A0A2S6AKZ2_9NOCA|nr:oxidoreductase [Nocardia nova]PPJ31652.1 short-chain dehydrogenase/reductase [Nocardia nova]PPJ35890.1 short-chain dehydrogenase/reductase [Nocardia nova]
MTTDHVWFITGTSSGFGRAIAEAVLADGGSVVATARKTESLADLRDRAPERVLVAQLDVTDPASITAAVEAARVRFGRIDVLVNNAGYGLRGALEECDDEQLRALMETNVWGLISVTEAVLPLMRAQRSGHIVQLSSVGGVRARLGGTPYALSKFAVEGLSEGLSYEVAPFGIKVTIVEPGPFRTDFAGRSIQWAASMPEYTPVFAEERERFQAQDGAQPGDPARAAAAILRAVAMDEPPLRLPLGPEAFAGIRATLTQRLADLDELEPWAADTGFR